MRKASFRQTWLSLNLDMKGLELEPFNARMTARQRFGYTFGVLVLAGVVVVLIDALAALFVAAAGLYAIWNPGNQVTKREKKVFVTVLLTAVYLGLLSDMVVLFRALIPWTLAYGAVVAVVWRR